MKAVDSSVVITAAAKWHVSHSKALECVETSPWLPAHCAFEVYSVLTRMKIPHRVDGELVLNFLQDRFPERLLVLDATQMWSTIPTLHARGIVGGAVYDGLIALTARAHNATLVTLDRRAAVTYQLCQIDYEML